jgi:CubicO group peptidase (beta-lactamase class C family)
MHLVGVAVAVVSADRVVHTVTLGDRTLAPRKKVTAGTHFNVASTTKSMTAALVATYVDEGTLGWDQKVVDAWSGFRAPTDELTRGLRVRDLLGMDSGLGEPPASSVHLGEPTAAQLLQSIVNLPVIAAPNTTYVYNNTVFAVGGYLPFLATKVAPADVAAAYANAMTERVFSPARMPGSVIADDPRGLVDDFASGYGFDLRLKPQPLLPRFGSAAPTGGALSTLNDLAAYLRLQLRRGQSVIGARVVSAGNLTECWQAHVDSHVDHNLDPDAMSAGYGMGWYHETFTDGSSLVWHNGGIDGFTAFLGFLPQHDLGLVVLNNTGFAPNGNYFYTYVLNLLLSQRFGLNQGVTDRAVAASNTDLGVLTKLGRRSRPIDPRTVEPFLGFYEAGYTVTRTGRELLIQIGSRAFPLEALPDGSFVVGGGLIVTLPVHFTRDPDGTVHMELVGLETVRRTNGLTP